MGKKKIATSVLIALIGLVVLFGCTSSDNGGTQTTGTTPTSNDNTAGNVAAVPNTTQSATNNADHEVLSNVPTGPGSPYTSSADACTVFNFNPGSQFGGDLSQGIYYALDPTWLTKNPGKTAEDFFNNGEYAMLILPSNPKGFDFCHKGTLIGENTNYMYCNPWTLSMNNISSTGEIQQPVRYYVTLVFEIKNITFVPIDTNSVPALSGGANLTYQIKGARQVGFACTGAP